MSPLSHRGSGSTSRGTNRRRYAALPLIPAFSPKGRRCS